MEISRDSWHYRLLVGLNFYVPSGLCGYFWKVVFSLFFVALMSLVVISFIAFLVLALFVVYPPGAAFIAAGIWSILGFGTLAVYREAVRLGEVDLTSVWNKEPGLLRSYIRAVLDKVCPLITFK